MEFRDLRAEGAFLVSANRRAGRTQWVRIKSLAGEPCCLQPGIEGKIQVSGDRRFTLTEVSPGVYQIDAKKGEEVVLYERNDRLSVALQRGVCTPRCVGNDALWNCTIFTQIA